MSPTTAVPRCGTKKQAKSREEVIVASAFDSIFELYPDKTALSKALDGAKDKCATLCSQRQEFIRYLGDLKKGLETVKKELSSLNQILDTTPAIQEGDGSHEDQCIANTAFKRDTMAGIVDFEKHSLRRTEGRLSQVRVELRNARAFVKMLEGANGVALTCGIKRRRDDFVKSEPDEARLVRRKLMKQQPMSGDEASQCSSEQSYDAGNGEYDEDGQDEECA